MESDKEESKQNYTTGSFEKWAKALTPNNVKKGMQYLSEYGIKQFGVKLIGKLQREAIDYERYRLAMSPNANQLEYQKNVKFSYEPLISIAVPTFQTPETFLRQMIESVLNQTYANFELCIADGSGAEDTKIEEIIREYQEKSNRIKFKKLSQNQGIAGNTNEALQLAGGEYIGLLDHDDILAPNALFEVVRELNREEADCIYTDEDKVSTDLTEYFDPHVKPDFDLDLLRSNNYICHFFVVKKKLCDSVGGFRNAFDGSQDYDFIFRCVEQAKHVRHISMVLYHWRTHKNSVADNPSSKKYAYDAGKRAIEAHLNRLGVAATVSHGANLGYYRVQYETKGNPFVSIVLREIASPSEYKKSVDWIKKYTDYSNYEIIKEAQLFRAKGEYLLFLNAGVKPENTDWLKEMLSDCQRPEVGVVGAKLYYNNEIYHAGIFADLQGELKKLLWGGKEPREYEVFLNDKRVTATYVQSRLAKWNQGYFCKAILRQQTDAVSGVCMMMRKNLYFEEGGFLQGIDRKHLDIEFCIRLKKTGLKVLFTPYAELTITEN